jgi:hypothetical protein
MLLEAVKWALLDKQATKSMQQHVVEKYALAVIFFSCIHFSLDWDEQNHRLLKN